MHGYTTHLDNDGDARGTGRAVPPTATRVLLSPIQFRSRFQAPSSPSTTFSSDEDEDEDEDDEEFYTPTLAHSDMDMYSSGGYSGDINMSSEVEDDIDFYEVESSQPPVMADAVRSFYILCPRSTL